MSSSFSLQPATAADIPALAKISGLSLEPDRHTMLKAAHPTRPYDHAAGMVGAFEYWLSRPAGKIELTKAVDDKTGQILGFVCWGFHLDQPEPQPQEQQQSPPQEESPSSITAGEDDETSGRAGVKKPSHLVSKDYVKTDAPDPDALARLEELTSAHLAAYQDKIMPPGTRAMYIVTIAVRPDAHGRGVGSALVRRGTDRADAEGQAEGGGGGGGRGVLCWVHSSEGGAGVFRACGFEVDDTLEIDLDEWARPLDIRPPPGEEKWGLYTFRYMARRPRLVR